MTRLLWLSTWVLLLGCATVRVAELPVEEVQVFPEDPALGPKQAPVVVVLFADFQ